MKSAVSAQTRPCRPAAAFAAALLFALGLPLAAAPSEGTAGQTVTGRSIHSPGHPVRQSGPGTVVAAKPQAKPAWKDLTPAQQQALQPLAPHWAWLGEERKRKWLLISKNYQTLPPNEQAKMHRRMSNWVTLSQQQRTQARQNFKEIKALTPEQKTAEWEAYQALSAEEKRKLATQARSKPAGVTTVKPAAMFKLTRVPARKGPASGARLADAVSPIQQNTLLPRLEPVKSEPERSPYEDEPAE